MRPSFSMVIFRGAKPNFEAACWVAPFDVPIGWRNVLPVNENHFRPSRGRSRVFHTRRQSWRHAAKLPPFFKFVHTDKEKNIRIEEKDKRVYVRAHISITRKFDEFLRWIKRAMYKSANRRARVNLLAKPAELSVLRGVTEWWGISLIDENYFGALPRGQI